jgi:CRP/FNR family transcriptional regulator
MLRSSFSIYSLLSQFFIGKEQIQKVKAGTVLFQEREPVEYVYLLLSGSVALGRVHLRGKDFTLKILNEEELIVEYQVFKHNPQFQFYAKTLTDCEIVAIKKVQFEEYIINDPDAMAAFVAWLSTSYIKAQMKCQDLIMNGKKGGLYSILIRLSRTYGVKTEDGILIDLPLTHQELANLTFGTREVIQRALKELREIDVISYEQQKFTIKNINHLKTEVDCHNCPYEICGVN